MIRLWLVITKSKHKKKEKKKKPRDVHRYQPEKSIVHWNRICESNMPISPCLISQTRHHF